MIKNQLRKQIKKKLLYSYDVRQKINHKTMLVLL